MQESNRSLGTAPHITVCNEVAKVMFLHLSVILSTGGGICLSACWDTTPPPPGPGSRDQAHPPGTRHTPLGPGPPDQAPPPRGQVPPGPDTPPDQTPPPRSRDGYCCGRYASYWNAFLFYSFSTSFLHVMFKYCSRHYSKIFSCDQNYKLK